MRTRVSKKRDLGVMLPRLVFAAAFSALLFELLLIRLFNFFLSNNSTFLAIPVTLFGLGVGSLIMHTKRREIGQSDISRSSLGLAVALGVSVLAMFWIFNHGFNLTLTYQYHPYRDAIKQIIFCGLAIVPFAFFGMLLAALFKVGAPQIGRFYGYDLLGAALACAVTPFILRYAEMHIALLLLVGCVLLIAVLANPQKKLVPLLALIFFLALVVGRGAGALLREYPDTQVLADKYLSREEALLDATEITSNWNDLSRSSLLLLQYRSQVDHEESSAASRHAGRYEIIQDAGASFVHVLPYKPHRLDRRPGTSAYAIPLNMGKTPEAILVMFAGVGRDMVYFNELLGGGAEIHGVEINPGVLELGFSPALEHYKLKAFFERPNIKLYIQEGRSFLDTSSHLYDVVFFSSNAATAATRTGHTRRFLDTREALEASLRHLKAEGVLIFASQPVRDKIVILEQLLGGSGSEVLPFNRKIIWLTTARTTTLVVKPMGFTEDEAGGICQKWLEREGNRILWAPWQDIQNSQTMLSPDLAPLGLQMPTDDRPYQRFLRWKTFALFPSYDKLNDYFYASSWIRIFTLALFWFMVVTALVVFYLARSRRERMPARFLAYFLATGMLYMGAEIGLMSKLELFVGSPLHTIAVVLAVFLLANGLGSFLFERFKARVHIRTVGFAACVTLGLALAGAEYFNAHLLRLPFLLKLMLVVVSVFPLAVCLGMFYPYGVDRLRQEDRSAVIPMSYGVSTLSSVLGSTYAMVIVIDIGFRSLILQTIAGYLTLAILLWLFPILRRR